MGCRIGGENAKAKCSKSVQIIGVKRQHRECVSCWHGLSSSVHFM